MPAHQLLGGGGGVASFFLLGYGRILFLKVHKHEIFFDFFAETETLWSQGPVTRDFENRIQFGRDIQLLNISAHAQHAMKFVPSMLSMR
jgi:hypothetical protein